MAMADHPAFFTVAPWGYRALTSWLVHALPVANEARGFRYVTLGSLTVAGGLLFLFLRRLGNGRWAALLGVAVFVLSPPVGQAVRNPFLAEPLGIALVLAFLLGLEARAGIAALCLLAVLAALCKEGLLAILLPVVFFVHLEREGPRRALLAAAIVCLPALVVAAGLPAWWTPHLAASLPRFAPWDMATAALDAWREWWLPMLLGGLTVVAALGTLRPRARPLLRRYGYLLGVTLVAPLAAATYTGEGGPGHFFAADVPRLLIYALPILIALALVALDRVWPHMEVAPETRPFPGPLRTAAAVLAGLAVVSSFLFVDRYRRLDLRGARDGPYVLGFVRETLRTAGRLDRGQAVFFAPETQRFAWGDSDPGDLSRMRWFLRNGWGDLAHYGTGDIVMQQGQAALILPCLRPRDVDLELLTESPEGATLAVAVNGRTIGQTSPGAGRLAVPVPAALLFRGDNVVTLTSSTGAGGARLRGFGVAPARR
jgi:hypothetical protein